MKTLRISLAQVNTIVGNLKENSDRICGYIAKARDLESDIVVFPELSLSGYPPEDLLHRPKFIQQCSRELKKVVAATGRILAVVGTPYLDNGKIFNAAAIIYDKKILGFYKKIHLPNYGVFDELRYFNPGEKCAVVRLDDGLRLGINICEDIWLSGWPVKLEVKVGEAKVVINISSSPYHAGKLNLRQNLLGRRAKENDCFICYCNLVGGQDELVFDGASMVFGPNGKLIARAKQFYEDLLTVDLDADSKTGSGRGRVLNNNDIDYFRAPLRLSAKKKTVVRRIEQAMQPLEEIYRALCLGLKDYCYKNGFKRVVLGLSGGVDSALVAAIAVDALGKENCFALSMPSMYSSKATRDDAKKLAKNLGIKLWVIPITGIYKKYLGILHKPFRNKKRDITEENLQARIRGNILMAFSNKFNYLVVATGNKSELSVGYCTLYGDTAGGFALIKDVPKTLVYKLAKYRNDLEDGELIPRGILFRAPTAELKKNQIDQDTLPAYSTLDSIIDSYIEKDKSIAQIVKKGISANIARNVVKMIDASEYKRRQYAVGVKITPKAFGRDRRMPITNRFKE